jgi:hypothetical protein
MRRAALLLAAGFVGCGLDVVGTAEDVPLPDAGAPTDGAPAPIEGGDASDASADAPTPACDTRNDPANCGACGHSCLGASCTDGLCAPTTLMTDLSYPRGLVITGGFIWVVETNRAWLWRLQLSPLGAPEHFFDTGTAPSAMSTSGPSLYWSDQYGVKKFVIANKTVVGSVDKISTTVLVDTGTLYYEDHGAGTVVATALDFSSPRTSTVADNSSAGMTTDATSIYWANENAGTITRANKDLSGAAVLIRDEVHPFTVAVDATDIYWTTPTAVRAATLAGGPARTLVDDVPLPVSLFRNGTDLYWLEVQQGGRLRKMSTAPGSQPVTLAKGIKLGTSVLTTSITFDDQYVYWPDVSDPDGTLKRVPK